jgi:hypothetical protein
MNTAAPAIEAAPAATDTPWEGSIPLSWARSTTKSPVANLGDALSALVVGAINGRTVRHTHFDRDSERMVAIGTIIQSQKTGRLHLWGTGMDVLVNHHDPSAGHYTVPPGTTLIPHAVRGPHTAAALRRVGVPTPAIYGDPAWFLPRILPRSLFPAEPTHEIGVICHISELESQRPESGVKPALARYRLDAAPRGSVRIINTLTPPTLDGLIAKMSEILSCRRILSSSFHGLVLPLSYGVPSLTFAMHGQGFVHIDAADRARLDHRFGDFFAGVGMNRVPAIAWDRSRPVTDWAALAALIDREHSPLGWTGRDLFDAFPGHKAVRFDDPIWPTPTGFRDGFAF